MLNRESCFELSHSHTTAYSSSIEVMASAQPSYAAIIDAGSSSSRLFIYQWQSDISLGEPLKIQIVFPSNPTEKKVSEAPGGVLTDTYPVNTS